MTLKDAAVKWFLQNTITKFLERLKKDKGKMHFLDGAKTYILAGLLIALGAVELLGIDVPGFDMTPQEAFSVGLGFIWARGGAKSDVKKVRTDAGLSNGTGL